MRVAFDCDGLIIEVDNTLRKEICELLVAFLLSGAEVIVWSGGGKDYAESTWRRVVREYRLSELDFTSKLVNKVTCKSKDSSMPDIAIDDQLVKLGHFNVCWPSPWFAERYEED
jgi:hypothetical protein